MIKLLYFNKLYIIYNFLYNKNFFFCLNYNFKFILFKKIIIFKKKIFIISFFKNKKNFFLYELFKKK
ncbi:hypothetical protein [Candidatus Carsonella ruddii]|uniref:Uncharacterized protein n=1 Tax=Candidatus Carsonella ruddii CE isolate Thao2000 TaxID=1202536 RepID=J7GW25_CARRU|nr:hypothetical protein [Candidatus Carsonella ruddii]AFP83606.1 hypothetical protein A33U_0158 [Candidatus Carsonella ruddii CE isolate Thao2000]